MLAEARELREAAEAKSGGGGSGGVDQMDGRVSRLEKQWDTLQKDVTDLKVGQATLIERVGHLPSKGFILTSLAASVATLAALATIASRLGWI